MASSAGCPGISGRARKHGEKIPIWIDERDLDKPVFVEGYGPGMLRYFGPRLHTNKHGPPKRKQRIPKAGVELHAEAGNNNGIVGGHQYFNTAGKQSGVLVPATKVFPVLSRSEPTMYASVRPNGKLSTVSEGWELVSSTDFASRSREPSTSSLFSDSFEWLGSKTSLGSSHRHDSDLFDEYEVVAHGNEVVELVG